jgi:hypothetical protein
MNSGEGMQFRNNILQYTLIIGCPGLPYTVDRGLPDCCKDFISLFCSREMHDKPTLDAGCLPSSI